MTLEEQEQLTQQQMAQLVSALGQPPSLPQMMQHQQRWGMPGAAEQIPGILGNTASMLAAPLTAGPKLMRDVAAGQEAISPETIHQATGVIGGLLGGGALGAEEGAVGGFGGKIKSFFNKPEEPAAPPKVLYVQSPVGKGKVDIVHPQTGQYMSLDHPSLKHAKEYWEQAHPEHAAAYADAEDQYAKYGSKYSEEKAKGYLHMPEVTSDAPQTHAENYTPEEYAAKHQLTPESMAAAGHEPKAEMYVPRGAPHAAATITKNYSGGYDIKDPENLDTYVQHFDSPESAKKYWNSHHHEYVPSPSEVPPVVITHIGGAYYLEHPETGEIIPGIGMHMSAADAEAFWKKNHQSYKDDYADAGGTAAPKGWADKPITVEDMKKFAPEPPKKKEGLAGTALTSFTPKRVDPEDMFKALSWKDLRNEHVDPEDIAKALGAPKEHVESLGFNTQMPLVKGLSGERYGNYLDPVTKPNERGIFFAEHPEVAEHYGTPHYHYVAPKNAAEVNWPDVAGHSYYSGAPMRYIIEKAREKGLDHVIIRNIDDMGGPQTQHVVINPANIRDPAAKFDPEKLHLNDLLAGLAGAGTVVGAKRSND